MKKYKIILTISFLISFTILFGQAIPLNKIQGEWLYFDKYTFKFLSICEDSTFIWRYSSCTSSYYLAGSFKIAKDTIILKGQIVTEHMRPNWYKEKTEIFLFRKNKIYTYSDSNNVFGDFQRLAKTNAKNIFEARQVRNNPILIATQKQHSRNTR